MRCGSLSYQSIEVSAEQMIIEWALVWKQGLYIYWQLFAVANPTTGGHVILATNQNFDTRLDLLLVTSLIVLVPVMLAFAFIVFLLYRQKRESHFRQAQLQLELEKSALEMNALRAQVNPHFIFNCLNSIQEFVHKHEAALAEKYLVKFSRLIRLVLENSTYAMVSMEDDLRALELYIQMEQLRLNHAFQYAIDTTGLDLDNLSIPPLLVQPFVENAIWHGLSNRKSDGKLVIRFSLQDDNLVCDVEDNGCPKNNRPNINGKSKSMGLGLIRKRLDLLGRTYKRDYCFTIDDQHGGNGKRIHIELPFEND